MALAVCIKCGEFKEGALQACEACRFVPESHLERAQSMVATEHNLPRIKLEKLSRDIRRGRPVNYPFERVLEYMDMFEGNAELDQPIRVPRKGCAWLIFVWILIGLWLVVQFS